MLVRNSEGTWMVQIGAIEPGTFDSWMQKAALKNGKFATKDMVEVDGVVYPPDQIPPGQEKKAKKVTVPLWKKSKDKMKDEDDDD